MKYLALAALVACGSNHASTPPTDGSSPTIDGTGAGSGISLDDYPAATAKAFCTAAIRCCGSAQTEAQCEAQYLMLEQAQFTSLNSSVASGKATYNEGPATTCLNAFANLSCADFNSYLNSHIVPALAACNDEVTGNVASGGTCQSFWECGPNADCIVDPDGDDGDPMTCIPDSTVGDTCDGSCTNDLHCDDASNTCVARKPDGSACVEGAECVGNACNANVCGTNPTCNGS
ncbi:MAG: hypothetical protein QM831_21780 [Kofleriaceae bacterium]